ncbi:MAG: hypothetical protein AAF533_21965 [Acidobacteriota bacterium]
MTIRRSSFLQALLILLCASRVALACVHPPHFPDPPDPPEPPVPPRPNLGESIDPLPRWLRADCAILPSRISVEPGEEPEVSVSFVTYSDRTVPDWEPVTDLLLTTEVEHSIALAPDDPGSGECAVIGRQFPAFGTARVDVGLFDDAMDPDADDPTGWSGDHVERLFPAESELRPGYRHYFQLSVENEGRPLCRRRACVDIVDPDLRLLGRLPEAWFEEPLVAATAGDTTSFVLHVRRNGYRPERPLTVRIERHNPDDPTDLFPIHPTTLTSDGVALVGEELSMPLTCSLHGPCFVGVKNDLHVSILDAGELLWTSRWSRPNGLGQARIAEAPLARLVHLGGQATTCEDGELRLRLIARNRFLDGDLRDVQLRLPLPPGLSVASHDLHFHDNPMDDHDPTEAELDASGTVRLEGSELIVDVDRIETRFGRGEIPPRMFRDMFEVDLVLTTDSTILSEGPLLLELTVDARSGSLTRSESDTLALTVMPPMLPGELSAPGSTTPLRLNDDTLRFERADTIGATTHAVIRGVLDELPSSGRCIASGLTEASHVDPESPPAGEGWYYLVVAEQCGQQGPAGHDSLARERTIEEACP